MYVQNSEILNQDKLYFCDSEEIKDYLISQGFIYLSRYKEHGHTIWVFAKTQELLDILSMKVVSDG